MLLWLSGLPDSAQAHTRSTSYSHWQLSTLDGRVSGPVSARVKLIDLTRMGLHPMASDSFAQDAAQRMSASIILNDCPAKHVSELGIRDGWLFLQWEIECPMADALIVSSRWLENELPSHIHQLSLQIDDAAPSHHSFSGNNRSWQLTTQNARSGWLLVRQFIEVGFQHILSGWDHLAFLLGLLLLVRSATQLLLLVSCFTLGHSLTLALSVLQVVVPLSLAVEILIAASILILAAESVRLTPLSLASLPMLFLLLALLSPPWAILLIGCAAFAYGYRLLVESHSKLRIVIVSLFGLVHGFGFAGNLKALQWPTGEVLPALLGFNLGVELGQLLLLAAMWPILLLLRRRTTLPVQPAMGVIIAVLGSYWLTERVLF